MSSAAIPETPQRANPLLGSGRASRWIAHRLCRAGMAVYHWLVGGRDSNDPRRLQDSPDHENHARPQRVLLTGQFVSDRWLAAHVRPLALSDACERVYVVSARPMLAMDKVEYVCPPGWLIKVLGQAGARTVCLFSAARRLRPDVVGGFHLLCNGLFALLVARSVGAKAWYFCVGGWTEVQGGGARGENRLFGMMVDDDPVVERQLVRAVRQFDLVVTMGTKARDFLRGIGATNSIEVIPGGIDPNEFPPPPDPRPIDVVGVFRLVPVKRIDVWLRAVAELRKQLPTVRAVAVGDGRLLDELLKLRHELGVDASVEFVGHQNDVPSWLSRSRVFLLTSDSEGVALSVMEALSGGCPVVVSDVGDLRDVTRDGENGYLVPRGDVAAFADRLSRLLSGGDSWQQYSRSALCGAASYSIEATTRRWTGILRGERAQQTGVGDGARDGSGLPARKAAPRNRDVPSSAGVGAS